MRGKLGLWLASLGWAALLLTMVGQTPRMSGGDTIFYILLGLAPVGVLAGWEYLKLSRQTGAKGKLLRLIGMQEGQGRVHAIGGNRIAVNPESKMLALFDSGLGKAYSYDEVRGWETIKQKAGEVYASAVSGGLVATGHNIREAISAAKATGFFVTVRDIDHPKWRVEMPSDSDQVRWMEILRQEVNGECWSGRRVADRIA